VVPDTSLRITEIFLSLQGEANTVGVPTVFVRLTGCPLRCVYCDSEYAFSGGSQHGISDIVEQVSGYKVRHVTVTGGEPLAQPHVHALLGALCDLDMNVSLETSGALEIANVDLRVVKVIDLKTPASAESHRNLWENMAHLNSHDQVKFVLCDRQDYEWAKMKCDEFGLYDKVADVLMSPSYGQLNATELADWIVEDRIAVRLQLQLHKLLWGDEPGR